MTVPQYALTCLLQFGEAAACYVFAESFQINVILYCGTAVAVPYIGLLKACPMEILLDERCAQW